MSKPIVSQSEADSWASCERKHYYAHGEKLQPKTVGVGLSRGNMGHAALEAYYFAIKQGSREPERVTIANLLNNIVVGNPSAETIDLITQLQTLLGGYFAHYDPNEWEVLAVEKEFRVEFDNYIFPFKPDLIVRVRSTGKIYIVDHKFLYNFYDPDDVQIMPQLPKYMGAIRDKMGIHVDGVLYNMIRWRDNAREHYKRVTYVPPQNRINRYLDEQEVIARHIGELKKLPLDVWRDMVVRTASSFNCGKCSFRALCSSDLDQKPGRDMLVQAFYEPNQYGYNTEKEEANG